MKSRSSDVAVIGAGIIGTSIAWRLAQAGLRVTIVDAGAVGGEASWAGAGMLAPGGEFDRAGPRTQFALESLALYRPFVEELRQSSGAAIDYQELGAIDLAFTAEEWEELRARAAFQSELGIPSQPLDTAQLHELVPSLFSGGAHEVAGALFFPRDALVNPRNIIFALQLACEKLDVEIHEHRPVAGLRVRNQSIEIESRPGILRAAAAVISAGAWSSGIPVISAGRRLDLPVSLPVRGHLLGYPLEAGSLRPILRHGHTYLLQRANGFTVAGSSQERVGFDRSIDPRIAADIHGRACAVLPCLRQIAYEPWVGFRPAVEGPDPEIRRLGDVPVWLSYGHYRNGILLAPATAQRVSAAIIASWGMGSTSSGESR